MSLDLHTELNQAFTDSDEPGLAELWQLLGDSPELGGTHRVAAVEQLKSRVFRITLANGHTARSVVLKRLEPAVAQRTRLVAERWLPALGLAGRCARLLGVTADRRADFVWHAYEDLGADTLATRCDTSRIRAAVDLIAELHTCAANHRVLPDARRFTGHLGMPYFIANVHDAIAALEALADARIEAPPEFDGVAARLLERLNALRDDEPQRTRIFAQAAGPDTLLHGDLWSVNIFVNEDGGGLRVQLVDWDKVGVGPFSYDLSTFLFRFPVAQRRAILALYRDAVSRKGGQLAEADALELLFDTSERARYANRVIWPAQALVENRAAWGFPELAEVERWFEALDSTMVSGA